MRLGPFPARRRTRHEASLARLADGSLTDAREADAARAEAASSPEAAAALAEQRRAVALLRGLDAPAPDALRARVSALTHPPPRRVSAWWPRLGVAAPLAGAMAAAAAVIVLVATSAGVGSRAPIAAAARVALAAAAQPPPAVDAAEPYRLRLSAGGISFPNWAPRLTAAGTAAATAGGHPLRAVAYTGTGGERVGYAIVAGRPLPPIVGRTASYDGVRYTLARRGRLRIVTWVRNGHTCVVAATSVSTATLLGLAEAEA